MWMLLFHVKKKEKRKGSKQEYHHWFMCNQCILKIAFHLLILVIMPCILPVTQQQQLKRQTAEHWSNVWGWSGWDVVRVLLRIYQSNCFLVKTNVSQQHVSVWDREWNWALMFFWQNVWLLSSGKHYSCKPENVYTKQFQKHSYRNHPLEAIQELNT